MSPIGGVGSYGLRASVSSQASRDADDPTEAAAAQRGAVAFYPHSCQEPPER